MSFINKSVGLRRFFYRSSHPYGGFSTAGFLAMLLVACLIIIMVALPMRAFLRDVSGEIAVSQAKDTVQGAISRIVGDKMRGGEYNYEYFVSMQKDSAGNVTAISANMAHINLLSSEILNEVIGATNSGALDLAIPLGNLTDIDLALGRGPKIPVKIVMHSNSYTNFRNEFESVGINQSKHQIILELYVEINVLMPWEVKTLNVSHEVLIAETIIVGKVPDTYLGFGD